MKNKLFFFTSYSPQLVRRSQDYRFSNGLEPDTLTQRATTQQLFNKLTYNPVSSLRFNANWLWTPTRTEGLLPAYDGYGNSALTCLLYTSRGESSSVIQRRIAEELIGKRVRIRAVKALGSARLLDGLTGTVVAAHPIASGWVKLDLDENSRTPHREWSVAADRLVLVMPEPSRKPDFA